MTAMQDLRDDLLESIFKINNRLDFLDNITDENVRNICKVMVDTTLKGIVLRIDDELLEMEKQQIYEAFYDGEENAHKYKSSPTLYYNETYGSKGSDGHELDDDIPPTSQYFPTSSQTEISKEEQKEKIVQIMEADAKDGLYKTEISDEEIEKGAKEWYNKEGIANYKAEIRAWVSACKWYREQLKQRQ